MFSFSKQLNYEIPNIKQITYVHIICTKQQCIRATKYQQTTSNSFENRATDLYKIMLNPVETAYIHSYSCFPMWQYSLILNHQIVHSHYQQQHTQVILIKTLGSTFHTSLQAIKRCPAKPQTSCMHYNGVSRIVNPVHLQHPQLGHFLGVLKGKLEFIGDP